MSHRKREKRGEGEGGRGGYLISLLFAQFREGKKGKETREMCSRNLRDLNQDASPLLVFVFLPLQEEVLPDLNLQHVRRYRTTKTHENFCFLDHTSISI